MGQEPCIKKTTVLIKVKAADFLIFDADQTNKNLRLHLCGMGNSCLMFRRECELVFASALLRILPIFEK